MNISKFAKAAVVGLLLAASAGLCAAAASGQPAAGAATAAYISASIIDYGADSSGVQDCSPAFARLMTAVGTNRHVRILIPPGKYRLAKRVVLTAHGNDDYYGMHIEGAGENVTEILVDNAEGGIAFIGSGISQLGVIVSDLTFVAKRDGAGTALFFDIPNPGVTNMRQFTARNVAVRGVDFSHGHFNTAVHVRNAWYALLQNVNITQQYQTEIWEKRYAMEYGILLEDCYSPLIADCRVTNGKYGIVQRAVKTQPEDGIIRGSYFVGNVESIVLDIKTDPKEWPEPGFHIDNCHVNYRDCGIRIRGVQQANISHTLFYCHDRSGTRWFKDQYAFVPGGDETHRRDFESRDVDIAYGSNIILDGNIFTEPANLNRVGVRIGPDSGYIMISGNQFNMSGTAIKNESTQPSYSSGNIFAGKPPWHAALKRYDDKPGKLVVADFAAPAKPAASNPAVQ